jgi:hypothetical protein
MPARETLYFSMFHHFTEVQSVISYSLKLMTGSHNKALESRILQWNEKLSTYIQTFSQLGDDMSIAVYDAYGHFTDILDHHGVYGFPDVTSICYDGCIWHDHIHPSWKVHELLTWGLLDLLNQN